MTSIYLAHSQQGAEPPSPHRRPIAQSVSAADPGRVIRVLAADISPPDESVRRMDAFLDGKGFGLDAKAIWVAHPNLRATAVKLAEWLSTEWPLNAFGNESAVAAAVVTAVNTVKMGIASGETDRQSVVANFHSGLALASTGLSSFAVVGIREGEEVESWPEFQALTLRQWIDHRGLESVIFLNRSASLPSDRNGWLWALRTHVAGVRDLGIIARLCPA